MLKATLQRLEHHDYRIFVGYYRNDPATAAAIASVADERIESVRSRPTGRRPRPTASTISMMRLLAYETASGRSPVAIVLHDAEDLVHPLELTLFDQLIDRAARHPAAGAAAGRPGIALDQRPLLRRIRRKPRQGTGRARGGRRVDPAGRGRLRHRARRAGPASPPRQGGRPFAGASMTEDYEMGLRLGALGLKTMFVRIPAIPGSRAVVSQPRPFSGQPRRRRPPEGALARRHRLRRLGPAGLARRAGRALDADARPPRPAGGAADGRRLCAPPSCGCSCGSPKRSARRSSALSPVLATLLTINAWLLGWRVLMRAGFITAAYGLRQGLLSIPRLVVGNIIAMLAVDAGAAPPRRRRPAADGTRPATSSRSRRLQHERSHPLPGVRRARLGGRARRQPGHGPGRRGDCAGCRGGDDAGAAAGRRDPIHAAAANGRAGPDGGRAPIRLMRPTPSYAGYPGYPPPVVVPYYYPVPASMPRGPSPRGRPDGWSQVAPTPEPLYYGPGVEEPRQATRLASTAAGARSTPPAAAAATVPGPAGAPPGKRFDRLQLTTWALLRGSAGPGNPGHRRDAWAAARPARACPIISRRRWPPRCAPARRSAACAMPKSRPESAGSRWPRCRSPSPPSAARRSNEWGGRNAFAVFAEGGLYQTGRCLRVRQPRRSTPRAGWSASSSRDLFFDGAATFTRPVWQNWSAGLGRLGRSPARPLPRRRRAAPDMDVRRGIRVHVDYRQRLAGKADARRPARR